MDEDDTSRNAPTTLPHRKSLLTGTLGLAQDSRGKTETMYSVLFASAPYLTSLPWRVSRRSKSQPCPWFQLFSHARCSDSGGFFGFLISGLIPVFWLRKSGQGWSPGCRCNSISFRQLLNTLIGEWSDLSLTLDFPDWEVFPRKTRVRSLKKANCYRVAPPCIETVSNVRGIFAEFC